MDNKEGKSDKEGCCDGGHRCCSGKMALALVLLLIGGLIGYGAGRCHSGRMGCPMGMASPMMAAPQK